MIFYWSSFMLWISKMTIKNIIIIYYHVFNTFIYRLDIKSKSRTSNLLFTSLIRKLVSLFHTWKWSATKFTLLLTSFLYSDQKMHSRIRKNVFINKVYFDFFNVLSAQSIVCVYKRVFTALHFCVLHRK